MGKKKASVGRSSKLTPVVFNHIVQAIRAGNYAQVACQGAGIDESTYYRWLKKGEPPEQGVKESAAEAKRRVPYRQFRQAIKQAEADAEMKALEVIRDAQHNDWKAAAWYLERRYPDRFGRFQRTEVTGKEGGPVELQVTDKQLQEAVAQLSDEQLAALESLLEGVTEDAEGGG